LIGLFFEYVSGIMDEGDNVAKTFRERAEEMAEALRPDDF